MSAGGEEPLWRSATHIPEPDGAGHEWVVVGGQQGGIVVRKGYDLNSKVLNPRLQTGAVVEELELVPGATVRLHYRKVRGDGPDFGWVSVTAGGKTLLKLREGAKSGAPQMVGQGVNFARPGASGTNLTLTARSLPRAKQASAGVASAVTEGTRKASAELGAGDAGDVPSNPLLEAESWNWRKLHLLEWTRGAFQPGKTVGEGRPPLAEGRPWGDCGKAGRVSVVTPTTESRQNFHETLWACFEAQVWPDKELVVVETYEHRHSTLFASLAKKDRRLVYLKVKVKPGEDWSIGLKRNVCTDLASGEFLAHFDDDDLYAPTYVSTMVREMQEKDVLAITLSSWYMFQTRTAAFRQCDPITWGNVQDEPRGINDPKVHERVYGYGFSYVYRRSVSLEFPYANRNMGEDYAFFSELLKSKGTECIALHEDKYGICLHTQHGNNTSNSFALWEVPRESVPDLEIADFYPVFDNFIRAFPGKEDTGDDDDECIKRSPVKRVRDVTVHTPSCDFRVRCATSATAAEFRDLLEARLGALPCAVQLFRIPPCCWVSDAERRSWASKVLKVLWPSAPPLDGLEDASTEIAWDQMYLVRRVRNAVPAGDRVGARTEELWLSLPDQRGPPGLGSETGSCRGASPVHVTCGQGPIPGSKSCFFHVDLWEGAVVSDLRRVLRASLPASAEVRAPVPGKGLVVLADTQIVPCRVILSDFRNVVTYDMVLTRDQAYEFQDLIGAAVVRPEFQQRLDEFEQQASRDSAQYRAGLAGLLMTEVYPDIQRHFGLEEGLVGQEAMFGALAAHGDYRITRKAYELEALMRNNKRAAFYYAIMLEQESGSLQPKEDPASKFVSGHFR